LRITTTSVTISLSATVALVCLFTPKLYIILLHPERNVRQSMMPSKYSTIRNNLSTSSQRVDSGTQSEEHHYSLPPTHHNSLTHSLQSLLHKPPSITNHYSSQLNFLYPNSPFFTSTHLSSPQLISTHLSSPQLTFLHLNSSQLTFLHPNSYLSSPQLTPIHHSSPQLTTITFLHLNSPLLIFPHLNSPLLIFPHPNSPLLIFPHLNSSFLTSTHPYSSFLTSSDLSSPKLTPTHLSSPQLFTYAHFSSPQLTSLHHSPSPVIFPKDYELQETLRTIGCGVGGSRSGSTSATQTCPSTCCLPEHRCGGVLAVLAPSETAPATNGPMQDVLDVQL
ncbi:hypothetical protein Pcinc_039024, partial [Petrolisthes cinctipes]